MSVTGVILPSEGRKARRAAGLFIRLASGDQLGAPGLAFVDTKLSCGGSCAAFGSTAFGFCGNLPRNLIIISFAFICGNLPRLKITFLLRLHQPDPFRYVVAALLGSARKRRIFALFV